MANSSSAPPRWVVFGAGGFIGGHLARELKHVLALTRSDIDLSQPVSDDAYLPFMAEDIFVLASAISPDRGVQDYDLYWSNIYTAAAMGCIFDDIHPSGLVFLSSIDVYGRRCLVLPIGEESLLQPESSYATSKQDCEMMLSALCRVNDIPLLTLRLPGVYGPGDTHHGPVRSFIDAAMEGRPITIHGDGNQRRDLLFVDDVVQIVRAWSSSPRTMVANAVTGTSFTLNELADVIDECAGRKVERVYVDAPQYDLEFKPSALLEHYPELRFTPMRDGVRQTWERLHAVG